MSTPAQNGPKWRNSPFARPSPSSSPGPPTLGRPKSLVVTSTPSESLSTNMAHSRNQSLSHLGASALSRSNSTRLGSNSTRIGTPGGTFAPQFISTEEALNTSDKVRGIEGENDFSGKRYVWLRDPKNAFVRGWVVEELDGDRLLVQCDDGSVSRPATYTLYSEY